MAGSEGRERFPFRRVSYAPAQLAVCAALAAGECVGFRFDAACALWPMAAFAALLVAFAGYGWRIPYWPLAFVFVAGMALALRSESRRALVFDFCEYGSEPLTADFRVGERVCRGERFLSFDSGTNGVKMRVMIRRPEDPGIEEPARTIPRPGEVWRCTGWLERKDRDERSRRTLWVGGRGTAAERIKEADPSSVTARIGAFRRRLSELAGIGMDHSERSAGLLRAMVLGERWRMPKGDRQLFADAGTVHVFAISGLHVGVVAGIEAVLLSALWVPARWLALGLAPMLAAYVVMIGGAASAGRAAAMTVMYCAAPIWWRKGDGLVAWSHAFLVFHVLEPAMLFDVGSLLSFTVMLGILLFVRWWREIARPRDAAEDRHVILRRLAAGLGVGAAAWAAGMPIAAETFGRITPGGMLANLAVVPLAGAAVSAEFAGMAAGAAMPAVAAHCNNLAGLAVGMMADLSAVVASLPGAGFGADWWTRGHTVAWYAALVLGAWLVRSVAKHSGERL